MTPPSISVILGLSTTFLGGKNMGSLFFL